MGRTLANLVVQYSFLILGISLIIIGTLFFFKKYESGNNAGKILGAFWLFTGMLITALLIKGI